MKLKMIICAVALLLSASARASDCIDWNNFMARFEADLIPSDRNYTVLLSFDDFTKKPGDSWLSQGIPLYISLLMNASEESYAIFGPAARVSSKAVNPAYTVGGMFQHVGQNLRIFVQLNRKGTLIKQFQLDVPFPNNRQFFDALATTAEQILAITGPKFNREAFNATKAETSVMKAYESYVRGLEIYWSFEPKQMDIAKTFFDEAKKADINYMRSYEGLIDMYSFLAMYNKQNRLPYSAYFQQAENEIGLMRRFSKRLPIAQRVRAYVIKAREEEFQFTNRFLIGQAYFIAGLEAAGSGRYGDAASKLSMAVVQVPEDAITWWHLADIYDKMKNKREAAKARNKALEINKCLQ